MKSADGEKLEALKALIYRWKIGRPGMSDLEISALVSEVDALWSEIEDLEIENSRLRRALK